MTTLAIMKDRMARELRRSNITTFIAEAITTAIGAYQDERFFFNEKRTPTFNTGASQEFYDSTDLADLNNLLKIDYVKLIVGNTVYDLLPDRPKEIEGASSNSTSTGQHVWYGQKMRLYPIPAEAGWVVRVAGLYVYAAPASDGEASNFWMTTAERLIRSRAKYELATHVLRDTELAQIMTANTEEAFRQLQERTNQLTQTGGSRVRAMSY